jgi:hypothetical protein
MAITRSTGTLVAIASTYGSSSNMTAITNAAEAVATLAAGHGVVVGDFLEVTSGWDRLNGRIVRAKTVSTNDVTFEGINTVSTSFYPTGTGTGTVRRITAWTSISQITSGLAVSGGDPQFADITTLTDTIQKQIPTTRTPVQVTLPVFYDPSLAWWATVLAASDSATPVAMRMVFSNNSRLVANGYWSLRQVPTVEDSTLRGEISVSFFSDPTTYAT